MNKFTTSFSVLSSHKPCLVHYNPPHIEGASPSLPPHCVTISVIVTRPVGGGLSPLLHLCSLICLPQIYKLLNALFTCQGEKTILKRFSSLFEQAGRGGGGNSVFKMVSDTCVCKTLI